MLEILVIWLFVLFEKWSFAVLLRSLTDQNNPDNWEGEGGGGGGVKKRGGDRGVD